MKKIHLKNMYYILCLLSSFLLYPLASSYAGNIATGKIVKEGIIDCFEEELKSEDNKFVYCEASGAIYTRNSIIIVNDKPIPNKSPIFTLSYPKLLVDSYLQIDTIIKANKYEDITKTLDEKFIIATTSFDRIKTDSSEWDSYNTIVYWENSKPETAKVISATTHNNISTSISLRSKISAVLNNSPYFKIEGIAVLPNNKLLIGVREVGEKYDNYSYVVKIISVNFNIKDGEIILEDNFNLAYEFDINKHENLEINKLSMGLSSLVYDKSRDAIWLLTSHESNDSLNGILWRLSLDDFEGKRQPLLITNFEGVPLFFKHKAEGITLVEDNKLFIIHDDDKVDTGKKPNQAHYTIVEIN